MKLNKIAEKSLIFDGLDDDFYKEYIISVNNGDTLSFSPMNVIELADFEKKYSQNFIDFLLENIPSIKRYAPSADLTYYKNEENITLYVKENDSYIAIISLGETQPSRYKIFIEAVFSKSNYRI
jgi:hypothetical protein